MQIIILRKNQTHTLKLKKWMFSALVLPLLLACVFGYLLASKNATVQNTAKNNSQTMNAATLPEAQSKFFQEKLGEMHGKMIYLGNLIQTIKKSVGDDAPSKNAGQKNQVPGSSPTSNFLQPAASSNTAQGGADFIFPTPDAPDFITETISDDQLKQFIYRLEDEIDSKTHDMQYIQAMLYLQNHQKFDAFPVPEVKLTSGFGWRFDPFNGQKSMHAGQDFSAPTGTHITAVQTGVVIASEYHHQYGYMMDIDHGNGLKTRYAHCSKLLLKVGDIVQKGDVVAYVGSTGKSTGAHLHFEVRLHDNPVDPRIFLADAIIAKNQASNMTKPGTFNNTPWSPSAFTQRPAPQIENAADLR